MPASKWDRIVAVSTPSLPRLLDSLYSFLMTSLRRSLARFFPLHAATTAAAPPLSPGIPTPKPAAPPRINGALQFPGEFKVILRAKNSLGKSEKPVRIVGGEEIQPTPRWVGWEGICATPVQK